MTAATNYLRMVFTLQPSMWKAEIGVKWKEAAVSVYSCYTKQERRTKILLWYYNSAQGAAKFCSVTVYSSTGLASSLISLLFKSTHTIFQMTSFYL
jgi:hypothetical protein